MGLWLRLIQGGLGGFAAYVLTAKSAPGGWEPGWNAFTLAMAIVVGTAVVEPIGKGVLGRRARRLSRLDKRISEVLKGALTEVIRTSGVDWPTIGVRMGANAFLVRHPLRNVWISALVRVGREGLSISNPSGIRWTRGKGAIGQCWEQGVDFGVDLARVYGPYLNSTAEEWESSVPDNVKLGLSYKEFLRVKHYGAVIASPIIDDNGKVRGCISIDAPGNCYPQLWTDEVRAILLKAGKGVWRLASVP